MKAFTSVTGVAIQFLEDDVNTDQIAPVAGGTRLHEDYAQTLFRNRRRFDNGVDDPDFVFNKPQFRSGVMLVAGRNFGCGSSREHAPIALGAAGVEAVVADSFARIFFRNCVATGECYPYDSPVRLCDVLKTGDIATLDFDHDTLTANGVTYSLKPLGEVRPVIEAGGIFNFARQSGMIPS